MGRIRFDFTDDVALVTGAASGIGLATALALARCGARVHGFDLEAPDENVWDLPEEAVRPVHHAVDVREPDAVRSGVGEVIEREGRIDLLVNNAGITRDGVLWKLSDEAWEDVLAVNLSGAFRVLRAVAPSMRERGRGRIVNVASVNALRGKFGQVNYAASKAGLVGLTRAAARELGPRGVTVNAVAPGMVETPMSAALPAEVLEQARAETAVGRLGKPGDVVAAILFLLSDAAAHVVGETLRVDGGQLS